MDAKQFHREYGKEKVTSLALDKELVWRLLSYLRPYRLTLVIAIIFLILSKGIEAYIPIYIGQLSQQILDGTRLDSTERETLLNAVIHGGFIVLSCLFISYLFDSVNVILKSWVGQRAIYHLRLEVYQHILHMPLSYFHTHTVGRLMTRTIHDVDQINQLFAESVIPIFGSLILFVSIFIGIFFINWKIGIMMFTVLPVVLFISHHFRINQRVCYERIRTVVAAMNTFMQENLMGAGTIRSFGLKKQAREHFEEMNQDHCDAYVDTVHHFSFFISSVDLVQNVSLIAAFAILVIWNPIGDMFEAGTYFTFSLYTLMLFRPLLDLAERYNVLQSAMAASVRIFDVLDKPLEEEMGSDKVFLNKIETLSFEDVWFAYQGEEWILRGVTFTLNQGDSLALVGMTGQGKSTIISLILCFYHCQRGQIKVNGKFIESYHLESIRRQFSQVLQDPVLFSGTVADNIALFNSDIKHSNVELAVDYLGMSAFINRLPDGIDHSLMERGKSLSIGEMQLISMARAVAQKRPILILDEATANIDTGTEKVIQKALKKVLHDKTSFVIAHRLSTIKDAGCILVLHDGKIAERGTHLELLSQRGIYEKLYRLQFVNE